VAGRTADKPGTFRIKERRNGSFMLSGVRSNGLRVKVPGLSKGEATEMAERLFPLSPANETKPLPDWSQTDDWGLPSIRINPSIVDGANKSLGLGSLSLPKPETPSPTAAPAIPPDPSVKERRLKNAKSLMELAGIAGAAGDVFVSRKLCERAGKEPVNPNPQQVKDLKESIRDALTEWFGDSEIAPWQMAILLALGIPVAMLLQSPKKKPEEKPESKPNLQSVP
jgi:hypothetical protein